MPSSDANWLDEEQGFEASVTTLPDASTGEQLQVNSLVCSVVWSAASGSTDAQRPVLASMPALTPLSPPMGLVESRPIFIGA